MLATLNLVVYGIFSKLLIRAHISIRFLARAAFVLDLYIVCHPFFAMHDTSIGVCVSYCYL